MLKRILTFLLATFLIISCFSFNTNTIKANGGTYSQLLKGTKISGGFTFKSGINRDVDFKKAAVFADTGVKVNGAKRGLKVGETVTVKIPNGFKYMDGTTYDIYVEVTTTKELSNSSEWIAQTVVSGNYDCFEISPFNKYVWQNDPYVTFDYKIYILDSEGNDAIKAHDIDLTAGSCWTAVNEGARPWGNDGTIYTNIPSKYLAWEDTIKGRDGKTYTSDCWHITNGSYNQLNYYILGHGTTEIKAALSGNTVTAICGGYIRNSESGAAEMMFGYFTAVAGDDYVGYYDGNYHSISVDTSKASGNILYCEAEDENGCDVGSGNWTSTKPEYKDVKVDSNGNPTKRYISYKNENGSNVHTNYVLIKPIPVTIAPNAKSKVYDGNTKATLTNSSGTEITQDSPLTIKTGVKNESFDIYELKGEFDSADAGNGKTVKVTYTTSQNDSIVESNDTGFIRDNYTFTIKNPTASITISNIKGVSASPYEGVYDGQTHNISVYYEGTLITEDNIKTICDGKFESITYYKDNKFSETIDGYKDVELDSNGEVTHTVYYKIITNSNYEDIVGYSTVKIKQKTVNVTLTAEDRAYTDDNDTSVTILNGGTVEVNATGVIDGESIKVSGITGSFEDGTPGTAKKINVNYENESITYGENTNKDNYKIEYSQATASIYPTDDWYVLASSYDGVYDGEYHDVTPIAKEGETTIEGTIEFYYDNNGEKSNLVGSTESSTGYVKDNTYYDKDATEKTIHYVFTPTDSSKYKGTKEGTFTIKIAKVDVEVNPIALGKYYDGNNNATIVGDDSTKEISDTNTINIKTGVKEEAFSISSMTGLFDDPSAGDNKKVTIQNKDGVVAGITNINDSGFKKSNYNIIINDTSATITKGDLAVVDIAYDGIYDRQAHGIEVLVFSYEGKSISEGYTIEYYSDPELTEPHDMRKDVELDSNGKVVSETVYYKITMDNYNDVTGSSTVTIRQKEVSVTPGAADKLYDGTTDASVTQISGYTNGLVDGESLSITGLVGKFEDPEVGSNKQVIIDSSNATETISGTNDKLDNYHISILNPTASIIKADIEGVSATPYIGTYDGQYHNISLTYNGSEIDVTNPSSTNSSFVRVKFYSDAACTKELDNQDGYKDVLYELDEDAGDITYLSYTVYYKIFTNDDYEDIVGSSTVTINPLTVYVTPVAQDRKYEVDEKGNAKTYTTILGDDGSKNDEDHQISVKGLIGDESIGVYDLTGNFIDGEVGNDKEVIVNYNDLSMDIGENTNEYNYIIEINDTSASIYGSEDTWYISSKSYVGVYDGEYHTIKPVAKTTTTQKVLKGTITYYSDENRKDVIGSQEVGSGYATSEGYKIKDATGTDSDDNLIIKTIYYKFESSDKDNIGTKYGQFTVGVVKVDIEVSAKAQNRYFTSADDTSVVMLGDDGEKLSETHPITVKGIKDESFKITSLTGNFDDGNPGDNKTVTISEESKKAAIPTKTTESGFNPNNYNIKINDTTASIYNENLKVVATPYDDIYDGKEHGIEVSVYTWDKATQSLSKKLDSSEYTISYYEDDEPTLSSSITKKNVKLTNGEEDSYVINFIVSKDGYNSITSSSTITIRQKEVSVSPSAKDKVYDGNTNATVIVEDSYTDGLVEGEVLYISNLNGSFINPNVGNNKEVILDDSNARLKVEGTNNRLDNYKITIINPTASITKASIDGVSASPYEGTYDQKYHNITLKYNDKEINVTDPSKDNPNFISVSFYLDEGCTKPATISGFKDVELDENDEGITHTVYYKIVTNLNYEDIVGSSTVKINQVEVYVSPEAQSRNKIELEDGSLDTSALILGDDNKTNNSETNPIKATGTLGDESISVYGLTGTFVDDEGKPIGELGHHLVDVDYSKEVIICSNNTNIDNYSIYRAGTNALIYNGNWYVESKSYVGVYDGKAHSITPVAKDKDGNDVEGTFTFYSDEERKNPISVTGNTYSLTDATINKDGENTFQTIYFTFTPNDTEEYVIKDNNNQGNFIMMIVKRDIEVNTYAKDRDFTTVDDTSVVILNEDGEELSESNPITVNGVGNESFKITSLTGSFKDGNAGEDKEVTISEDSKKAAIPTSTTATGFNPNNYNIKINDATASINKGTLKVNVTPYVGTYDGDRHNITLKYNGETIDVSNPSKTNENFISVKFYIDSTCTVELSNQNGYKDVELDKGDNVLSHTVYYKIVTNDNYEDIVGSSTVTINPIEIKVTPTAEDKVYDGNTKATVNQISNFTEGLVSGEKLSIDGLRGEFKDPNVGDDKEVVIDSSKANMVISGSNTNLDNYKITVLNPKANITKASIGGVEATPYEGIYGGDLHNITLTYEGKKISVSNPSKASENFVSITFYTDLECKNKLSNQKGYKDVELDNEEVVTHTVYYKIETTDNYEDIIGSSTVKINPREVEVTPTAEDKVYDGTVDVTVNAKDSYSTGVKNESFTLSITDKEFKNHNVGNNKEIDITYTIKEGASFNKDNYIITVNNPTASITPRDITVSVGTYYKDKGQADPDITLNIKGDIVEKDKADFNSEVKYSIENPHEEVGKYKIDITKYKNEYGNYNITYIPGILYVCEDNNRFFKAVVDTSNKFTEADMTNTLENLLSSDKIIPKSEQSTLHWGEIYLTISDTDTSLIPSDKLDEIKKLVESLVGSDPKIEYFDAMLYKISDKYDPTEVHEPGIGINISVKLPDELVNSDSSMIRTYKIIRYHKDDGSVEYLDTKYDEKTHTISFTTDKFSTFALAYKDTKKPSPSDKGHESCEEHMNSNNWTWSESQGKCVYKVDNTDTK